ncbi:hypothetical protein E5288_WYG009692 [Bos mutus]|uniref:Uncharacterized protein n=1 Tax=Bos mutus TaxID=72004 RepID=A0A6B0R081_9CETA|nr:hypothetical protein [Bos mutus]
MDYLLQIPDPVPADLEFDHLTASPTLPAGSLFSGKALGEEAMTFSGYANSILVNPILLCEEEKASGFRLFSVARELNAAQSPPTS